MTRRSVTKAGTRKRPGSSPGRLRDIDARLDEIERSGGSGELEVGGEGTLKLSSLGKLYFPDAGISKGALMRYYVRVWPVLGTHLVGRPLVLKRYPDGVEGQIFYQQNAGAHVPAAVRVAEVATAEGSSQRIVGGELSTLLYTVQLGAIEMHPWLTRMDCLEFSDRCLIDLDPADDVPYSTVVMLARDILAIAKQCELPMAVKTSGSSGMHLVIPLPPRTTFDTALELAMLISRVVEKQRPADATTERSIRKRPAKTVYVDAMQNSRGKSMASAYSVRPNPLAMVSTPLHSRELTPALDPSRFTLETVPARVVRVGDIWSTALAERPTTRAVQQAMRALRQVLDDEPATPPAIEQRRKGGEQHARSPGKSAAARKD